MAWNFCAYCGTRVEWPPPQADGRLKTRQNCKSCGRKLYRNPDVHLLCLAYRSAAGPLSRVAGQLFDQETIQEGALRLLSRHRLGAGEDGIPRLFAIVSDLDSDCVHLVFRAHLAGLVAPDEPIQLAPWVMHLEDRLREMLQARDHSLHTGVVRMGLLQLTQHIPE